MPLDIFNVVEPGSKRVVDVYDNNFPVGFAFVQKGHDAEHLDLFYLTGVTDLLTNFTNIQWVVVTLGLSFCMGLVRIFPSLTILGPRFRNV
jgi:hypothetical protein